MSKFRGKALRPVALALMLVMVAGACSGAKNEKAATGSQVEAGKEDTTETSVAGDAPSVHGDAPPSGDPAAPAAGGSTSGSGSRTGRAAGGTSGSASGGSTQVSTAPGGGTPTANLFTASEDKIGISDSQITLCTHAALTFAQAFDTRPEDINVYWQMVNEEKGGVFGRKVVNHLEDDAYRPDQAVVAAQACKGRNPFILLGGIGFDQIPAVRNFVETNHMLYIHHIAREDLGKKYSFSYLPTVEKVGDLFAQYMLAKYRSKKVGAVWRQSEYWEPGHKGFKARIDRAGMKLVADLPVQKDQAVYSQQISELQARGAEVVWLWENALVATEFIKQAKAQNYSPKFVIFPFNTTTDILSPQESMQPPLEGLATWPAYAVGQTTGPYAPYAEEIKKFEATMAKYRRGVKPNDILFMTWLAYKQLHELLLECGKDCTRNKVAGLMLSGQHKAVTPLCAHDFSKGAGHVAGYRVSAFETWRNGDVVSWRETAACKESF